MKTLILALWALLSPGSERLADAPRIASAIEHAVAGRADAEHWAATMAVYAWKESSLRPWVSGDGGRSCGAWQMRCELVRGASLEEQASLWLRLVDASSLGSVDSSPRRAEKRAALADRLLERLDAHGVTSMQPHAW